MAKSKNNVDKPAYLAKTVKEELAPANDIQGKIRNLMASDYTDPKEIEIDLTQELLQTFREQFDQLKKEGYSGSFLDFLKSEIKTKRNTLAAGGIANGG